MSARTMVRIARAIRRDLGVHFRMIGDSTHTVEAYQQARAASDAAEALLRYLVCHLANAHDAHILARAAGAPAYINFRGRS